MDEENNASLKKDTITNTETISIKSNGINQNISNINLDINFDNKDNNNKFSNENEINNSNKIVDLNEKSRKEIKDKTIKDNELLRKIMVNQRN